MDCLFRNKKVRIKTPSTKDVNKNNCKFFGDKNTARKKAIKKMEDRSNIFSIKYADTCLISEVSGNSFCIV
jgi:hypothetical protein